MLKPDSLRAALVVAIPHFAKNPDELKIFISKGRIAARETPALGYEWRYTLEAILLNFTGNPDAVALAVIIWLRTNQPELLANHQAGNEAIKFQADVIDATTIDMSIELELNEAVVATPRAGGGYDIVHRPEIQVDTWFDDVPRETVLEQFYLDGDLLLTSG